MSKLLVLCLVVFPTFVFADSTTYENYDCKFSNEEVQQALQTPISNFFDSVQIQVVQSSFRVQDAATKASSLTTTPFAIMKKITFEVSSGEKLALVEYKKGGIIGQVFPDITYDGVYMTQGKYEIHDQLGNFKERICTLTIPYDGMNITFKNLATDKGLRDLSQQFIKQMGNNFRIIATKEVP